MKDTLNLIFVPAIQDAEVFGGLKINIIPIKQLAFIIFKSIEKVVGLAGVKNNKKGQTISPAG